MVGKKMKSHPMSCGAPVQAACLGLPNNTSMCNVLLYNNATAITATTASALYSQTARIAIRAARTVLIVHLVHTAICLVLAGQVDPYQVLQDILGT
jgi:putative ubiquitin-RnfH superfamily antitoxin RatB of RatAB toxin-antitoxin module